MREVEGFVLDESESLSSALQARLANIRGIHLVGEIGAQGAGTRSNPRFSEFVVAPTVHTPDAARWNRAIDRVKKALVPFSPEVEHTVVHEDGMIEFPSIVMWRVDTVWDQRASILLVPTEAFGLSVVRYFNKRGGMVDPDFERRTCMVTPEELALVMGNHSLHSAEYRSHHSQK